MKSLWESWSWDILQLIKKQRNKVSVLPLNFMLQKEFELYNKNNKLHLE